MVWLIAQPITLRENRSNTTARYNQDLPVSMYVKSLTHFWLAVVAENSWFKRFGANYARLGVGWSPDDTSVWLQG